MNDDALMEYLFEFTAEVISRIGFDFKAEDLRRWNRALQKIQVRANFWIEDEMQRLCAIELSHKQIGNIQNEKQFGTYKPYHPRYEKWKNDYFPGRPFWILRGNLVQNIRAFPITEGRARGRDWMAGVPSGAYDNGGNSWLGTGDKGAPKPIAMYGKKAEELRPMFEPTQDEYAAEEWPARGEQALEQVGGGWS